MFGEFLMQFDTEDSYNRFLDHIKEMINGSGCTIKFLEKLYADMIHDHAVEVDICKDNHKGDIQRILVLLRTLHKDMDTCETSKDCYIQEFKNGVNAITRIMERSFDNI